MNIETLINTVLSSDLENEVKVALLEILFEKKRTLNATTLKEATSRPYKPDVSYIPPFFKQRITNEC